MQNKPNFQKAQMNVSSVKTMNYEQITMNNANKNKPNLSLPKGEQTQSVVNLPAAPVLSLPKGVRSNRRTYFKIGKIQQFAKLLVYWYNSTVLRD